MHITNSRNPRPSRYAAVLLLAVGAVAAGCADGPGGAARASASGGSPAAAAIPEVLATIGGEQITLAEVRERVGDNLDALEAQYQRARFATLDRALQEILRERVLIEESQRTGKSMEELVVAEAGGSLAPSPVEVSTWYTDNQARLGGRTLDQLRSQIEDLLRTERRDQAMARLQERLNAEREVRVFLEPYRMAFDNRGAPAKGPTDAPVTLVEFSDFECPYCARFYPTLYEVTQKYGDQVRIVYRQYPIPNLHPYALKAAEASLCAHEQDKFWELHDLMFQDQKGLDVASLKSKARRLGLNQSRFDSCLDSGRYAEQVQQDMREGSRSGVSGTPAVFINGVQLEGGAVAFDVVARAIDRELARLAP